LNSFKKIARGLTTLGGITMLATAAQAGELDADCTGWTIKANLNVHWQIDAVVTLERLVEGQWVVWDTSTDSGTFDGEICLQNIWNVGLPDGMYRATGAEYVTVVGTGEEKFFRTGPVEFVCANVDMRTPGYWKNHDWPVQELMIGSQTYSRDCLLELLWTEVKGDIRIILAKHLIAAKLNVLSESTDSVASTITNADAYLDPYLQAEAPDCPNPFFSGSKPSGAHKQDGAGLKDILDTYNNNGDAGS